MGWLLYSFEAKSIQSYILAGGRLRHIVGGSVIVDRLASTGDLTDRTGPLFERLDGAGLSDAIFLRCAGGAFSFAIPFSSQDERDRADRLIDRFRLDWTWYVRHVAPGLLFVDAKAEGDTVPAAVRAARRGMDERRSRPSHDLPIASPLVLRAARTGLPAVRVEAGDVLDENLAAKERVVVDMRIDTRRGRGDRLAEAFVPKASAPCADMIWPIDMETEFPFLGEDETIAVLHADGNRMGEIVIALGHHLETAGIDGRDYAETFLNFSLAVDRATRAAAEEAGALIAHAVTDRPPKDDDRSICYPARPIVLGGDDLTVILRPDIAVDFTLSFLAAFQRNAKAELGKLLTDVQIEIDGVRHPLPDLTACAGLVFCKADKPYVQVQDLAEQLCKHAKAAAKGRAPERWQTVPSCFSFHRLATSHIGDYDEILHDELRTASGEILTMQPYYIEPENGPSALDLVNAVKIMRSGDIKTGGLRQIAGMLYRRPAQAREDHARLRSVVGKYRGIEGAAWKSFFSALRSLLGDGAGAEDLFHEGRTPILDVVSLAQVLRRQDGDDEAEAPPAREVVS